MDTGNVIDGQRHECVFPAFKERREAADDPHNLFSVVYRFYRNGADNAVDSRGRSPANDDSYRLFFHRNLLCMFPRNFARYFGLFPVLWSGKNDRIDQEAESLSCGDVSRSDSEDRTAPLYQSWF